MRKGEMEPAKDALIADAQTQIDALSAEKADLQAIVDKLKETAKGTDYDAMKAQTEELTNKLNELAPKFYQQEAAAQGAQENTGAQGGNDDTEYTVVDD